MARGRTAGDIGLVPYGAEPTGVALDETSLYAAVPYQGGGAIVKITPR